MILWDIFKENYVLLSFFTIMILVSVFLLVGAVKSRSKMSKRLLIAITIVCALLIGIALLMMTFIVSFGYNS